MKKILFVCSANKQRSKTASDYFSEKYNHIEFDSAGTNHKICNKEGTQPLTEGLMNWADLVIVMEEKHRKVIVENGGSQFRKKIEVLSIPDRFKYYQKQLIVLLEEKVEYLFNNKIILYKLKVEFGIPEHGWILMNFKWQDFNLKLDLSNVPTDPMEQLCDTLIQISSGIKEPSKVIWHLEPHCYYFKLKKVEGSYKVIISESDEFESKPEKVIKEFEGSYEQIILPLYRSIKKFNSYSYQKPHWDEIDSKKIMKLTNLIK